MARRPKHAKPDGNQAEIIADLRRMGVYLWITAALGGEVLDAIAFWRGRAVPIEFKAVGSEFDLTEGERKGIRQLHEVGVQAVVATCTEDVVSAFVRLLVADAPSLTKSSEWRRGGRLIEYDVVGELGSPLDKEEGE